MLCWEYQIAFTIWESDNAPCWGMFSFSRVYTIYNIIIAVVEPIQIIKIILVIDFMRLLCTSLNIGLATGVPVEILAAQFPIRCLANMPRKTMEEGPSICAPAIHMEDLDGVPSPWLFAAFLGGNQQLENLSFCFFFFMLFCLSNK